ncbi:hypothetical protein C5B91_20155 [Haloferax sp. Atlit-10N]|uniref:hypothetical protein n=1 Tax=unclassified Haloferax TaxID=2625095 RepID=UPI000E26486D|nr:MULTISPECIES: hypothetical protein [unclassified Haloferax]RDZ39408.1 hypothetical protein C5B87_19415 [Haloferax sp. Atlit-16N]RDZ53923.1 hypothetical protein C5B91_20155 [Haloferax sp. Atlit-10N]
MTDNDPLKPDNHDEQQNNTQPETRRDKLESKLRESTSVGQTIGDGFGKLGAVTIQGLIALFSIPLFILFRIIPKSHTIAEGIVDIGYKLMLKSSGGDTIINQIYGDGVVKPVAGSWNSEDHEFRTVDGQEYKADRLSFPYRQNGKYALTWALREGREITDPLEAYMGGQRRRGNYEEHLRTDGAGKDVAIHAETEGFDGRALSFRDGFRLFGSKVTQQDMKRQETRGKLAELDWSSRQQLYLVLIFAAGLALGMFGPSLATSIAGGGGGVGGGLSLPIFATIPGVI